MKNTKELKQEMFEGLFETRVKRYDSPIDGKHVDTVLVCNNKSLQSFFEKLYVKHKVKYSMTDFISECQYWTYMAVQRFEVRDAGSWEEMIAGTDKPNMGRLVTAIKNTVEPEIVRFLADGIKFSTTSSDGETFNTATSISFTSLDMVLMSEDGQDTNLIDAVTGDMNFWGEKDGYMANHFTEWFKENKERILTKSQLELLNNLQKVGYGNGVNNREEIQRVTGKTDFLIKTHYLERIKVRVLKAWQKEKATEQKTQLQMQVEKEVNLWTGLYEVMADVELEDENQAIAEWFIKHLDVTPVMNLVYDNIMGEEIKQVVAGKITSKVIYKLMALVEKRLDSLQMMDTTSVKFYKKPEEMGRWTPEAHAKHAKELKAWKEQPVKVYKRNADGTLGELLREEPFTQNNKKKTKKYSITPMGVSLPVNEVE